MRYQTLLPKWFTASLGLLAVVANCALAQSSATSISFQGALNGPTGQPLPNGNYSLTFRFWDGPAPGGVAVSTNITVANVSVAGGVASTAIPVDPAWFNGQTRYLGVTVGGGSELLPRVLVTAVPYAVKSLALVSPTTGLGNTSTNPVAYASENGWLGIGTGINPPSRTFEVNGSAVIGFRDRTFNSGLTIRGRTDVVENDSHGELRFDFNESGAAKVQGIRTALGGTALIFRTNDRNAPSPDEDQEHMRLHEGRLGIRTPSPATELHVNGTTRTTVLQITSDRRAKQRFAPVNGREVLAELVALPITTWAYTNAPAIRHLGPVAQDFAAAFGVGEDDQHIATVDADGVALAAIQGLHEVVTEQQAALRARETEMRSLQERLERLERLIHTLSNSGKEPNR